MKYPAAFLEQLRHAASVSAVIGARIPIKRHGREFQALCPFHKEKTPSFTINDDKSFYHCFGCGAHGDAISFIKEYEGISYKEAIEKLAGEMGMALPQPTREAVEEEKKRRTLQDVNELACRWFEAQLAATPGYEARQYLVQRGLNEETIHRFRLGFAPEDRMAMPNALKSAGVSDQEMIAAGLLIKPDNGREPYARFRGRVIFPIRDKNSKVVAFGGRLLAKSDTAPKYLNSPETELFHKGFMLYNHDLARRAMRDETPVLVCEGYMDVIALAQAGIATAVAPLGTAVTAQQLQQLWQLADEPILCLDGDAAGMRAMNRAAEVALPMLAPAKSLRFMILPEGEDPDTLVRSEGKQGFLARTARALPMVEQLCREVLSQPASTPEARAGQEQRLNDLADQIQHQGVRAHYREHIRQQIWKRPSFKKQSAIKKANNIPNLPNHTDLSSRKVKVILRGFALLFANEELRGSNECEWFLDEMEMPDAALQRLQANCRAQLENPQSLQLEAVSEPLQTRIRQEVEVVRRQQGDDPRQPRRQWQQMMAGYRHACLLEEYALAEREMAEAMTPERWERFTALKSELDAADAEFQQFQQEQLFAEG